MTEIAAVGVSAGLGIGKAYVMRRKSYVVPKERSWDIAGEQSRFEEALASIVAETRVMVESARSNNPGSAADILDAYLTLLLDPAVSDGVRKLIAQSHNAAEAVQIGIGNIVDMFENMEDDYMRDRAFDIMDIEHRLLNRLLGYEDEDSAELPPGTIIVAEDLATSDTARLDMERVSGIVTVLGGLNSHASIVARSLDIPAVVGAKEVLQLVTTGDDVLLDGFAGEVCVSPTPEVIKSFQERADKYACERDRLRRSTGLSSSTRDGVYVSIGANIGCFADAQKAKHSDADGIGLFRSEFLHHDLTRLPDEDTQFRAYRDVVIAMAGKPVTIRTLDVGADKSFFYLSRRKEANPALGYRGIRVQLDHTDILRAQLRACLRASSYGRMRLLIPLISSVEELRAVKSILSEVKGHLHSEGIPFDNDLPLGIMIEVPSAVMMADQLALECDFFSIGTNDLIQYAMAVDRSNAKVSHLYSHYHPAVLRMIQHTLAAAEKANKMCAICGEAASDPLLLPALAGMGVRSVSVVSGMIPKCRSVISGITITEARSLADEALRCATILEVEGLLKDFARKHQHVVYA